MIKLYDADTEAEVGEITEEQLDLMIENLVEESLDEYSWNIDPATVSALESGGVDSALVGLLRRILGSRTSRELRYEPE